MASNMASVFADDSTEEITLEIEPSTHLKDSKLEREGTYEIDGENLYISFPEEKDKAPVPYPSLPKQSKTLRWQSTETP